MSPPLPVTEDTPPDMLAGSMDLRVVLPSGHNVKMRVDRSTPMMDLLVQVTTANKISPGGHVIQALGERGVLPYKPSTPIGALDTWTIHIVPKNQIANSGIKKAPLKPVNQPFEQTFRLQVHLPRNQLYVSRVSPKARLSDILLQVCSEKNLDSSRYSLRHPTNLEQVLNLKCTLADYKLQEVTLVYNTTLPVEVTTVDIMALQRDSTNTGYNNYINRNNRSCEGSVSSGSLGGRSLSPVPSDESSASPPPPPPSRPIRKRRPAPKPPTINNTNNMNGKLQNESETSQSATVICHSRNSSDSSGYHEASVLSESPQSNSLPDSLPRRSKLPSITSESEITETTREVNSNNLSRSLSSLTAVENSTTVNMRQYQHSISTSSLSTAGGRKKKAAPPPPPTVSKMSSLSEEQQRTPSVSSTASSTTTLDGSEATNRKSATLPALGRLPSISAVDTPEKIPSPPVDVSSLEPPESPVQAPKPLPRSVSTEASHSGEKLPVKYRAPLPKPRTIIQESQSIEEKKEIVKNILHRSQSDGTTLEVTEPNPAFKKLNTPFTSIQRSHKALIDELAGKLKKSNSFDDGDSSDSTITNTSDNPQENINSVSATSSVSSVFFKSEEVSTEIKLKETVSDADLLNKDKNEELHMKKNISVSCLKEANSISTEPGRLGRWKNVECLVDDEKEQTAWVLGSQSESSPEPTINENSELRLADEEIDRIFHNATRDHTSLESGVGDEPPLSLSSLPSPPASLKHKDIGTSQNLDSLDWEYKLPAPPTFRDENNSPPVTEYGTLTIGNLTQVFNPPSLQTVTTENKTDLKRVVETGKSILKEESVEKNIIVENKKLINETTEINTKETTVSKSNTESKIAEETVVEKSAIINELSTVISDRISRTETAEPVKRNSPELTAPSTLDNFTITTYKDTKPIEVFEDESIKSSVGEKRDTSKDDALFRAPKARIAEPNLTRTNSFSTEEKSFHPTVKRSVSYVSLLAANMPRTSQPYRAHLAKSNLGLAENGSDSLIQKEEVWPRLRKTSSELNISRGSNDRKTLFDEQSNSWQKSEDQSTDLQSLQVLRSILPQLSNSQNNSSDVAEASKPLDEPDRVASISKMKLESTLVNNQGEQESKSEHPVTHEKPKRSFSVDDVNLNKEPQRYKYSGPPTINLSTWSERPKRQVSIKNDRDYVIGIGKKQPNTEENQTQTIEVVKENSKPVEPSNITMRLISRTNSRTERPKSAVDLGHVPIVRAVELKKPFVGSNIDVGYTQGKTISSQKSVEESVSSVEESFVGVNSLAQRFGQSKPRPVSSYLFGTESQIKSNDVKINVQSQTGVSKVVLNAGKKFTSIVGINGPESKTEVKTTGDKQTSRVNIGGFEERKLKLNTTLPNKIDYTSSSDIKALSKIRSGGIIDPSSPIEAVSKPNFPEPNSPSTDSTSPASVTTPTSPNVVNPRTWKSSTSSFTRSNSSSSPLSPNSVSSSVKNTPTTPLSPKTNIFFGSNTIDRSTNIRPSNFPLPVVKGFRTTSESSESSGGIPPPPPVMPVLKPVGSKKIFNTLPPTGKDPRDQLLESIRSFGKEGLKKVNKT